jgi:hypothetical protein
VVKGKKYAGKDKLLLIVCDWWYPIQAITNVQNQIQETDHRGHREDTEVHREERIKRAAACWKSGAMWQRVVK